MTGRNWIELINNNRQSILDQMRPYWADAVANRRAGLEILLYLEDTGQVTSLTRTTGENSWRQGDHLLPLGDAFDTRPDEWQAESDIINNIITNNALYDW